MDASTVHLHPLSRSSQNVNKNSGRHITRANYYLYYKISLRAEVVNPRNVLARLVMCLRKKQYKLLRKTDSVHVQP